MDEWQRWIGREQVQRDVLTPALLARFRGTFDNADTGDVAPQGIHWCLCTPVTPTSDLDSDGHPKRGDFLPPIPLPRRMWASSKVDFHRPITVGAQIERRSVIAEIREKTGATGPLVFVDIDHTTMADNMLAVSERQTLVYREAPTPGAAIASGHPPDARGLPTWSRQATPDTALLFRYSALTFNSHRIHYDLPYAMHEEGYPGLVVHGPLSASLLLDLAHRNLGSNTLVSFGFRGVAPAYANEPLDLIAWTDGATIDFSVMGPDGGERVKATAAIMRA